MRLFPDDLRITGKGLFIPNESGSESEKDLRNVKTIKEKMTNTEEVSLAPSIVLNWS